MFHLKFCIIAMLALASFSHAQSDDSLPTPNTEHRTPNTEHTPHPIAIQILHRSLLESVWGKPIVCEVRQNIEAFDKQRTSFGKYVRAGQGSGRMRLSLQTPAGDRMNSLTQISDGEVLSTLVSVGEHSLRAQVDLGKVRDRLTITTDSLHDPATAMYLAIGGQAESLRKLIQQYEWTQVTESRWNEQTVWILRGRAAKAPSGPRSLALIDVRLFEERTGLLPHRAELIIGHIDSPFPFWVYQVKEAYQETGEMPAKLQVTTEWDSPVLLANEQLVPDLFRLGATDGQSFHETREETKLYLPPASSSVARTPPMQPMR